MKYFKLSKENNFKKMNKKLINKDCYSFEKRIKINIYENNFIRNIFVKKLDNKLKILINQFIILDDNDDDTTALLLPTKELRYQIFNDYSKFLTKDDLIKYENLLMKFEKKCQKKKKKGKAR